MADKPAASSRNPLLSVGIDAGSSFTRCLILSIEHDQLRYIGHGEHPSGGWLRGRLHDPNAVTESIRWAVRMAECTGLVSIEAAVIGLGGSGIDGGPSRWRYELGRPRRLDAADLELAIKKASRVQLAEDRVLLQVFPQSFTVDGRSGFRNPKGLTAELLEAQVHLITASDQEHQILVNALHSAHVGVQETVFEAMAAAYGSLTSDERRQGVALVDIGLHSSDLVVYNGDALVATRSIPIGGEFLTRDLAQGLMMSPDDAETVKTQFGGAWVGLTSPNSFVEVPAYNGRPSRDARRIDVNDILQIRAEELFEAVEQELIACGMRHHLLEGLLLCGGSARLPGLLDLAEKMLECPARIALPTGIKNLPDALHDPAWTTVAGLAMYSARLNFRKESQRRVPGFLSLVFR